MKLNLIQSILNENFRRINISTFPKINFPETTINISNPRSMSNNY